MKLFIYAIDINIIWSTNAVNKAIKVFIFYWVPIVTNEIRQSQKKQYIYDIIVRGLFFECDHREK